MLFRLWRNDCYQAVTLGCDNKLCLTQKKHGNSCWDRFSKCLLFHSYVKGGKVLASASLRIIINRDDKKTEGLAQLQGFRKPFLRPPNGLPVGLGVECWRRALYRGQYVITSGCGRPHNGCLIVDDGRISSSHYLYLKSSSRPHVVAQIERKATIMSLKKKTPCSLWKPLILLGKNEWPGSCSSSPFRNTQQFWASRVGP